MSRNATHAHARSGIALDHWQELRFRLAPYGRGSLRVEGTRAMLQQEFGLPQGVMDIEVGKSFEWIVGDFEYRIWPSKPVWIKGSAYAFMKAGGEWWELAINYLPARDNTAFRQKLMIDSIYARDNRIAKSLRERKKRVERLEAARKDVRFTRFLESVNLPKKGPTGRLIWDRAPTVDGARASDEHSA